MWGFGDKQNYGENFNNVQAGLRGMNKISSTYGALAVVLIDGSMVPWSAGSLPHMNHNGTNRFAVLNRFSRAEPVSLVFL